MGCQQTKSTYSPTSVATRPEPYVKGVLKKTRPNEGERSEKLTALKRKSSTLNKSVNFDDQVRIKLRTPTPKQNRYNKTPPVKIIRKHVSNENNDDQVTSVSSEDENDHFKPKPNQVSPLPSITNATIRRTQSIEPSHANRPIIVKPPVNSVAEKSVPSHVIPVPERSAPPRLNPASEKSAPSRLNPVPEKAAPSNISPLPENSVTSHVNPVSDKPTQFPVVIQQLPISLTDNLQDNSSMITGTRFRVRRKTQYAVLPQNSSVIVSPSPTLSQRSSSSSNTLVQRQLPNINPILVEHHIKGSNDRSTLQTNLYTSNRRAADYNVTNEK